jgi:hypothetical protein
LGAAIQQPNPGRTLKLSYCLGGRGLREVKMVRCLRDAARTHDRIKKLQVAQLKATIDLL